MDIVLRAIEFAARFHDGQKRKGSRDPYISHPFAVGVILLRHGCDDEVVAAGILHDTLEDTKATAGDLRREFGDRVTALVEGASEPGKWSPWLARKRHTIEFLQTASLDARLVAAADKLHNLLTMERDLALVGEALWRRFKRGRSDQEWYYRQVAAALMPHGPDESPLFGELLAALEQVFG